MGHVLAFSLDTTFGRITADMLVILVVAANAWAGWRFGLVRRALAFASIYAAVLAAAYMGNSLASLVGASDKLTANTWSFVVIFTIVIGMFEIMSALYQDRIQTMIVITFDRVAGLVAGCLVGVLEIGVVFLVAVAMGNAPSPAFGNNIPANYRSASDAVSNATLGEYVVGLQPGLEALFGPVLPSDLSTHLAEGTHTNNPS